MRRRDGDHGAGKSWSRMEQMRHRAQRQRVGAAARAPERGGEKGSDLWCLGVGAMDFVRINEWRRKTTLKRQGKEVGPNKDACHVARPEDASARSPGGTVAFPKL